MRKKRKINICHYHLCRKRTKVHKCKYCNKYFCKDHFKAKPPGIPDFKSTSYRTRIWMQYVYRRPGHPCYPYVEVYEKIKQKKEEEYGEALDWFLAKKRRFEDEDVKYEAEEPRHYPDYREYEDIEIKRDKRRSYKQEKINRIILFIMVLLAFSFIIYSNYDEISNYFNDFLNNNIDDVSLEEKQKEQKIEVKTTVINELINSYVFCYELEFEKRPELCLDVCKKVAGEYTLNRCTGNNEVYCRCTIEIKEYVAIQEEIEEETTQADKFKEDIKEFYAEPITKKTKEIELSIFKFTNKERINHGIHELKLDEKLSDIAREHSLDMAKNDYFSHVNLNGEDPTARAIRHSYNVEKSLGGGVYGIGIGENINAMPTGYVLDFGYVSSDPESIAVSIVETWMRSEGHRENILDNQYDVIGIGVAYDGFNYIATQNFK